MYQYLGSIVKLFTIVYILCNQIIGLNSKTSILWKLNTKSGQIDSYSDSHQYLAKEIREIYENDAIFSIIASPNKPKTTEIWNKMAEECCTSDYSYPKRTANHYEPAPNSTNKDEGSAKVKLDCGHPVGFSFYDDLIGVASRYSHPSVPDLDAATLFLKNKDSKSLKYFNVDVLENRLKRAKHNRPWTAKLFSQIGNFWRIKGNAGKAIDCFRNALTLDPSNADVLHDMARVLFSLQYLDDAIFLVRRSLEQHPSGNNAWRAYFTLGELFRACGQFQQSVLYFRQALDLYPEHEPILKAIRDIEDTSQSSVQFYTMVIILLLVTGVVGVLMLTTSELSGCSDQKSAQKQQQPQQQPQQNQQQPVEQKSHRHFNRAMAMKSLKGFTSRSIKSRRN